MLHQLSPIFVAGDQCYLFDWKSCLEQTACSLVTQIVEVQVFDLEFITCAGECRTYRSVIMRKDRLCPMATILTPNQFELEWLGGRKLETVDRLVAAARTLANPSSSTVVVTGASLDDGQEDRIVTFAIEGKSVWSIATPKLQGSTSGAGDLFAALFVSSLIGGSTTAVALADAVSSTFAVLKETVSAGAEEMRIVTSASSLLDPPVRFLPIPSDS